MPAGQISVASGRNWLGGNGNFVMKLRILYAGLVIVGLMAGFTTADSIQLTGVIRDFKVSHPDMQRSGPNYNLITNMVMPTIGEDRTPVLNADGLNAEYRVDSAGSFYQWFHDVPNVNIAIPHTIVLDNGMEEEGGLYTFAIEKPQYFFPIDGRGWNDTATDKNGNLRNFYFTYEIHTEFTYSDPAQRDWPMVFTFTGDDDVWVYINDKLAVDIGGVHGQKTDSVNLDAEAASLGLEPGGTYKLDFFFAERHTTESNFRIETTMQLVEVPPTTVSPLYD